MCHLRHDRCCLTKMFSLIAFLVGCFTIAAFVYCLIDRKKRKDKQDIDDYLENSIR